MLATACSSPQAESREVATFFCVTVRTAHEFVDRGRTPEYRRHIRRALRIAASDDGLARRVTEPLETFDPADTSRVLAECHEQGLLMVR